MLRPPLMILLCMLLAACAHSGKPGDSMFSDHLYWRPAVDAIGWAVLLPGSSGLTVFDDETHYFDHAERLTQTGWSVLLVDYRAAYRAADNPPHGNTGEKIAWVIDTAVSRLHRQHVELQGKPGVLMGWSLGAEGVLRTINDGDAVWRLGIDGAVLYYPSNQDSQTLANQVPLLIVSGAADDVTPASEIRRLVDERDADSAPVRLTIYDDAHHGFDIASLSSAKTLRLLPLVGPTATLQYHPEAAAQAQSDIMAFLAGPIVAAHGPQPAR